MEYTTYLFDFDYTLADSSKGIVICFRNVLERHGHTNITDEQIKRTIGKTLEESFTILTGIDDADTLASYRKEYVKEADEHMNANTILFPETIHILQELKKQRAKIGIVSTKFRYRIQEVVDKHFPKGFFDIIIGGEDVKAMKPDPKGIHKALKKLHRNRKETLYIGDSTVDAQTAQNAKVDFVGVLNGMTICEELEQYPHRQILENLSLLPLVQRLSVYKPSKLGKLEAIYRMLRIKQIRGKKTETPQMEIYTCKNCGEVYAGNYCTRCGQTYDTPRFTIRNAFQNILSGFFNIDDGFSRNLLEFLYRPGYMIRNYLDGKRVHYFKPFQTLFVLAALYVIAVQLFDPTSMRLSQQAEIDFTHETLQKNIKELKQETGSRKALQLLEKSAFYADSARIVEEVHDSTIIKNFDQEKETAFDNAINDFVDKSIYIKQHWKPIKNKLLKEDGFIMSILNLMESWIHGNKAFSIIALLPILTFGVKWGFRRTPVGRRLNTTELFFSQVYIAAQFLWLSILILPFTGKAHLDDVFDLDYGLIFLLFIWDFRQLFGVSWGYSFKRTIISFGYCFLLLLGISILLVLLSLQFAWSISDEISLIQ